MIDRYALIGFMHKTKRLTVLATSDDKETLTAIQDLILQHNDGCSAKKSHVIDILKKYGVETEGLKQVTKTIIVQWTQIGQAK